MGYQRARPDGGAVSRFVRRIAVADPDAQLALTIATPALERVAIRAARMARGDPYLNLESLTAFLNSPQETNMPSSGAATSGSRMLAFELNFP